MTIATYESLLEDEYRASGRLPKVAIIGQHDFDALCGEISLNFGVMMRAHVDYKAELQFRGIAIFVTYAHKQGVWFGGGEV